MCKNREEQSWHEMEFRFYRGESSNYMFEVFMAVCEGSHYDTV